MGTRRRPSSAGAALSRGRLIARLARGAWPTPPPPLPGEQVAALASTLTLAQEHGLAPLLWRQLHGTLFAQSELGDELGLAHRLNRLAYLAQADALAEVTGLLASVGVEPVLLKGLATARLYPEPAFRPVGDLDLWVRTHEVEPAVTAFRRAGYRDAMSAADRHLGHRIFAGPNEQPVDLVVHLSQVPRTVAAAWWRRAVPAEVAGVRIRVLAPADELVYLCLHAAKHEFRLAKWLVDITLALAHFQPGCTASPALPDREPARSQALVALGLAQRLLGAPAEPLPPVMRAAARRAAAPWERAVLRRWDLEQPLFGRALRAPAVLGALRQHPTPGRALHLARQLWPDPLEAAVYLGLPLWPVLAHVASPVAYTWRGLQFIWRSLQRTAGWQVGEAD